MKKEILGQSNQHLISINDFLIHKEVNSDF